MVQSLGLLTTNNWQLAEMNKDTRRSGSRLILAGLLGIAFFALTDPRSGWAMIDATENKIDAVRDAATATYVGIAGSLAVLMIGLWLMTRRTT